MDEQKSTRQLSHSVVDAKKHLDTEVQIEAHELLLLAEEARLQPKYTLEEARHHLIASAVRRKKRRRC